MTSRSPAAAALAAALAAAAARAEPVLDGVAYLARSQAADGSWRPRLEKG